MSEGNEALIKLYEELIPEWEDERRFSGKVAVGCLAVAAADFLPFYITENVVPGLLFLTGTVLGAACGMRWAVAADTVSDYQQKLNNARRQE